MKITGSLMDLLVDLIPISQAYSSVRDVGLCREFLVHFGPRAAACRGNSGEAHTNEHVTKGDETGYDNENGEEDLLPENSAVNLFWNGPEDKNGKNDRSTSIEDPLIEYIRNLQDVQEALEEEVQKFRDIGTELISPDDDSAISTSAGITTVDLGHSSAEEIKQAASISLEFQISSLTQQVLARCAKHE